MTITAFKTSTDASDYIKVSMGQNDEFVVDFSGNVWGKASPNDLTGIRARVEADNGIGVDVDFAIGRQRSFETLTVAATATSTVFFVRDAVPASNFVAGRRVYVRNETENEVRACAYDPATRKVTITEAFGRIVLPTDTISFSLNEDLTSQPKTAAGSTASVLRLNDAGRAYIHKDYDIEIVLSNTRHVRRVTAVTDTHTRRSGSPNYNATAVDTTNDTITFTASNFRILEAAGTVYVAATGNYSGWSVGDIVELRALPGAESRLAVYNESGTKVNLGGSGSPSGIQLNLVDPIVTYTLNSALPSSPPNDTNVYPVAGARFGQTAPLVETASPITSTVIPITQATWNSAIHANDDLIYKGLHRDISSVSNSNRTITLSTALPSADIPNPGDQVEIGHSSDDFHDESDLSIATGDSTRTKELTINHAITALKFKAIGGAANTVIKIELAGNGLPDVSERI